MEYNYTSHYRIIETFKETEHQAVYIGVELTAGIPVVVNHIKNQSVIDVLKNEPLEGTLNNLVYVEALEEELVIITKVMDDTQPLLLYLEENYIPIKNRMSMALQYLKGIASYDHLKNATKNILIDEGQLVMVDDTLVFDELLLINEGENDINFNELCIKVSHVLEKIIYFEYRNLKREEYLLLEVQQFIEGLKNNNKFHNLKQILDEYRKLYIYHLCMESIDPDENDNTHHNANESKGWLSKILSRATTDEESADTVKETINEITHERIYQDSNEDSNEASGKPDYEAASRRSTKEKRNTLPKKTLMAVSLLLLLGLGVYGFMSDFSLGTFLRGKGEVEQKLTAPRAYFTTIRDKDQWEFIDESIVAGEDNFVEEYLWEIIKDGELISTSNSHNPILSFTEEGEYVVSIKVKDAYNQWSEKYSEKIIVGEPDEEDLVEIQYSESSKSLTYTYSDGINRDNVILRNHDFSLKVEKVNNENPKLSISTDETDQSIYDTLTLWVKGSTIDKIDINIKGYNRDQLNYEKDITHLVKIPQMWEMLNVTLNDHQLNEIILEFSTDQAIFWIADIQLDTFK
ncbi:PKD domain-containing protein [Alkaliphilus transvaalensis]|uniref:PKD domain-containing protein n=1 Tax=Alkaliphilus transvaalensis TaxID=114628 RepID=UPI00047E904E|nr:hypothetical protein [Alkaliphilus transvaalensis]